MTWNLHIVGDKVLEEVDAIGAAIVKAIEDAGHQLVSAVLTTDVGAKDLPVAPAAPEPAPTVAGEPVASTQPPPGVIVTSESVPTDTPPVPPTPDPTVAQ